MFYSIQFLRYIAALLVVVSHAFQVFDKKVLGVASSEGWMPGTFGVDVFFIISGFVMASSSRMFEAKPVLPSEFLLRRFSRIIPLYWLAIFMKVFLLLSLAGGGSQGRITGESVAFSLMFVPYSHGGGDFSPVLPVGWTLNYEMFFYIVFALGLAFRQYFFSQVQPWMVVSIFVVVVFALISIVGIFAAADSMFLFWGRSVIWEFIAGMLLWYVVRRNWHTFSPIPIVLALIGLVEIFWYQSAHFQSLSLNRASSWGVVAFFLVWSTIYFEPVFERFIRSPAQFGGDVSYSMYLGHTFVLPVLGILAQKYGFGLFLLTCLSVFLSTAFAFLVFRYVERPLLKNFAQLIGVRRQ
jgi:exopolysaccharide production protein ExoZ